MSEIYFSLIVFFYQKIAPMQGRTYIGSYVFCVLQEKLFCLPICARESFGCGADGVLPRSLY